MRKPKNRLTGRIDAEIRRRRRRREKAEADATGGPSRYRNDPVGFCHDVLNVTLTNKQIVVLEALCRPPHQVMVRSANNCGKSFLSACAAIWFYMTRDPSVVILTAPTFRQVVRVTFKEIRRLYGNRPGMMPKAPHIQTNEFHVLTGFTATDENSFQGLRELSNMIVFEECIGIAPDIWSGAAGILSGGDDAVFLAIHNPTDGTSQAYLEEQSGAWTVFAISAFEHPNIAAELCGERPPIPAAVRLNRLLINMKNWGEYIAPADATPLDVDLLDPATYGIESISAELAEGIAKHFPGRYWRATTPEGDARLIGRYPQQSAYAIFSEGMFDLAERIDISQPWQASTLPIIGCDVARFGDDATCIHVRRGRRSLGHESYRGKGVDHTAGRLKELAREFARDCGCNPLRIPVHIDDTGVGGGVVDLADGFNFIGINAGSSARDEERYPNIRSEALFDLAETLASGSISLSDLPREARLELRRQAIGITFKLDAGGRRVAEPKAKTKERLRRSPDDLDAFSLAYYEPGNWYVPTGGTGIDADRDDGSTRRGRDGMSQIGSGDFGSFGVDPVPYQDGWNRR